MNGVRQNITLTDFEKNKICDRKQARIYEEHFNLHPRYARCLENETNFLNFLLKLLKI